jgi:RNA polymerase sigma factor (sigma-70 family)
LKDTPQPFEQVVARHGASEQRVCRAALSPHTDAEDAWSETFLAALRAWPDLPADANVEAWLVTIAHRKAIDVTRRRQRHAVPVERLPEEQSTLGLPDESATGIWAAVGQLPVKQRQAVAYHYLGGLPYREVAAILGGSTDAARRAAADGIRSLRARWDRAATGQPR